MAKERFSIGTDPEFFLRDKESGRLVSAIPYVKGTKNAPVSLPSGAQVQHDNVALEFATLPAKDGEDFVQKIRRAFMDIAKILPEHLELDVNPAATFEKDQLDHPEAKAFGCSPDYDAWELQVNEPPEADETDGFRSCGGHIHVGFVEGDGNDFLDDLVGKVQTVRMMDMFHGIVSTILDNSEEAVARRRLYGKAGCHRPTEYGVEYRTLSNFWLKSPTLVMLMDSLTSDVLRIMRGLSEEQLKDLDSPLPIFEEVGENIPEIINTGNSNRATSVLEKIKKYMSDQTLDFLETCMSKNTLEISKEWGL